MKPILYLLIFLLTQTAVAQPVPSSCAAPDSVIKKYAYDADYATLAYFKKTSASYVDSAIIPNGVSDTVLRAMIAVYNATTSLPASDSVVNMYGIHQHAQNKLNNFSVSADENAGYVVQVKNNLIPTGFVPFDDLVAKYGLTITGHAKTLGIPGGRTIYFASDSNYNVEALGNEFLTIPNMWYSFQPMTIGSGNFIIVDTIASTHVYLTYSFGWMDCPSGCVWRHNWHFRVGYDCSVEFLGGSGDPAVGVGVTKIERAKPRIYPNPAAEVLHVEGTNDASYSIFNIQGQVLEAGKIKGVIAVGQLPDGVYFIRLQSKDAITTHQFVKY